VSVQVYDSITPYMLFIFLVQPFEGGGGFFSFPVLMDIGKQASGRILSLIYLHYTLVFFV